MINLKQHIKISLWYFLIVAILGVVLRLFFVTPISANYRFLVHTHSHIALLGWVYIALTSLIYKTYFTGSGKSKTYTYIFWFTNVTIIGMLFSFPFKGYALLSILFSTLFLFATYVFTWFVIKHIPLNYRKTPSYRCIRASLLYLVISSIGPWALGGIMATLGKMSIWYKLSIYFYLHFQYNAWFILALCGLFFTILEKAKGSIDLKKFNNFFLLLNTGIILSFFLSTLWLNPPGIFYFLAAAGALAQMAAFYKFFKIVYHARAILRQKTSAFVLSLLKISGMFLILKILLQVLTSIPYFAKLSFLFVDFVIGYLHLVFLGVISITLFALLVHFQLLKLSKPAFWIYFTGFVISEILIFYKGAALWLGLGLVTEYFPAVALSSVFMPIAILIILIGNSKKASL